MKGIFAIILLLSNLILSGCATNTQTQNTIVGTLVGAGAGALAGNAINKGNHGRDIAIGAVVGALIGGLTGHYINSADHNTTYPFMSRNYGYSKPLDKADDWDTKVF